MALSGLREARAAAAGAEGGVPAGMGVSGGEAAADGAGAAGEAAMRAELAPGKLLPLAVATSIDALAVGVSFAFTGLPAFPGAAGGWLILPSVALIGATTFLLSCGGFLAGRLLGERFRSAAGAVGGCVLVLIGLRILLDGLGAFG